MKKIKMALVEEKPKEGQPIRISLLKEVEGKDKCHIQLSIEFASIVPTSVEKAVGNVFFVETSTDTYIVQLVPRRKRIKVYLMAAKEKPQLGKRLNGYIIDMDADGMKGFRRVTTSKIVWLDKEDNVYVIVSYHKHVYYCIQQKDALY